MEDLAFSEAQLAQLRQVLREEFASAGLRLDGPDHVDSAREDFRFLRRLRQMVDGAAAKIGWAIIAAMVGGFIWIVNAGLGAWKQIQ